MFALLAGVLWFLVSIGVDPDEVNFVWLGAALLALHFAAGGALWPPWRGRAT